MAIGRERNANKQKLTKLVTYNKTVAYKKAEVGEQPVSALRQLSDEEPTKKVDDNFQMEKICAHDNAIGREITARKKTTCMHMTTEVYRRYRTSTSLKQLLGEQMHWAMH